MEDNHEILKAKDIANRLNISKNSVYTKIKAGTLGIPHIRAGKMFRFFASDVDAWIEQKKRESIS
jgi:excisionase family DNA binding protein